VRLTARLPCPGCGAAVSPRKHNVRTWQGSVQLTRLSVSSRVERSTLKAPLTESGAGNLLPIQWRARPLPPPRPMVAAKPATTLPGQRTLVLASSYTLYSDELLAEDMLHMTDRSYECSAIRLADRKDDCSPALAGRSYLPSFSIEVRDRSRSVVAKSVDFGDHPYPCLKSLRTGGGEGCSSRPVSVTSTLASR
jgi:hypothetical protein